MACERGCGEMGSCHANRDDQVAEALQLVQSALTRIERGAVRDVGLALLDCRLELRRAVLVLEWRQIGRPAAPEAPQGPTPPATFSNIPLTPQGGRKAAGRP
ncbi:MAG: hypothetical protein WC876_04495 [Candidatus Thermoplasmatota archaeon]|jgi:hypothetical protein